MFFYTTFFWSTLGTQFASVVCVRVQSLQELFSKTNIELNAISHIFGSIVQWICYFYVHTCLFRKSSEQMMRVREATLQ